MGQFNDVEDSNVDKSKTLTRSNAFLVESPYTPTKFWDETVAQYKGVKHFGVLPPTHVATPQGGHSGLSSQVLGDDSQVHGGVAAAHVPSPQPVIPAPEVSHDDGNDGNPPDGEEPAPNDEDHDDDDEEAKKERKSKSSREWHAKWIRKGVPRVAPAEPEPAPPIADHAHEGHEIPELPPPANMREACQRFVSRWIIESGLPASNERRRAAYTAWNNSEERRALMAGRANVQI